MAELLYGTYSTGAVVIADSGDVLQLITDLAQGLNGTIAYTFESYERKLVVQFRSLSAKTAVFNAIKNNNGSLTFGGNTYLVKTIDMIEHFDATDPIWEFNFVLYRD